MTAIGWFSGGKEGITMLRIITVALFAALTRLRRPTTRRASRRNGRSIHLRSPCRNRSTFRRRSSSANSSSFLSSNSLSSSRRNSICSSSRILKSPCMSIAYSGYGNGKYGSIAISMAGTFPFWCPERPDQPGSGHGDHGITGGQQQQGGGGQGSGQGGGCDHGITGGQQQQGGGGQGSGQIVLGVN